MSWLWHDYDMKCDKTVTVTWLFGAVPFEILFFKVDICLWGNQFVFLKLHFFLISEQSEDHCVVTTRPQILWKRRQKKSTVVNFFFLSPALETVIGSLTKFRSWHLKKIRSFLWPPISSLEQPVLAAAASRQQQLVANFLLFSKFL